MDVLKVIAKRIKLARVERDLNQEGLAELLNISPKAVSKWERGKTNWYLSPACYLTGNG